MRIVRKNKNFSKKNFSKSTEEIWDAIIENNIATEDECSLVTDINGYSKNSLNDIIYARTGYHDIEQYLGEDEEEDFACGSKGKKKFAEEPMYMNPETGSVGTYEDWWYDEIDDDGNYTGEKVNAVDLGEVFELLYDEPELDLEEYKKDLLKGSRSSSKDPDVVKSFEYFKECIDSSKAKDVYDLLIELNDKDYDRPEDIEYSFWDWKWLYHEMFLNAAWDKYKADYSIEEGADVRNRAPTPEFEKWCKKNHIELP